MPYNSIFSALKLLLVYVKKTVFFVGEANTVERLVAVSFEKSGPEIISTNRKEYA
jgi:hypothetical protein